MTSYGNAPLSTPKVANLSDVFVQNAQGNQLLVYNAQLQKFENETVYLGNGGVRYWSDAGELPEGVAGTLEYTRLPGDTYSVRQVAAGGGGVSTFAALTDVSVAPTIPSAVVHFNATSAKWEQAEELKVDHTSRAIALLTDTEVGIQSTNSTIAVASAQKASVTSLLANVELTSVAQKIIASGGTNVELRSALGGLLVVNNNVDFAGGQVTSSATKHITTVNGDSGDVSFNFTSPTPTNDAVIKVNNSADYATRVSDRVTGDALVNRDYVTGITNDKASIGGDNASLTALDYKLGTTSDANNTTLIHNNVDIVRVSGVDLATSSALINAGQISLYQTGAASYGEFQFEGSGTWTAQGQALFKSATENCNVEGETVNVTSVSGMQISNTSPVGILALSTIGELNLDAGSVNVTAQDYVGVIGPTLVELATSATTGNIVLKCGSSSGSTAIISTVNKSAVQYATDIASNAAAVPNVQYVTSAIAAAPAPTGVVVQNGNSFAGSMVIGTNDANTLTLETSGAPRFIVASNASTLTAGSGPINITAASGAQNGVFLNGGVGAAGAGNQGGGVIGIAGNSGVGGTGGGMYFSSGNNTDAAAGSNITFLTQDARAGSTAGLIQFQSGNATSGNTNGGDFLFKGGRGFGTGRSGDIRIETAAGTLAGNVGGSVYIQAARGAGGGANGRLTLLTGPNTGLEVLSTAGTFIAKHEVAGLTSNRTFTYPNSTAISSRFVTSESTTDDIISATAKRSIISGLGTPLVWDAVTNRWIPRCMLVGPVGENAIFGSDGGQTQIVTIGATAGHILIRNDPLSASACVINGSLEIPSPFYPNTSSDSLPRLAILFATLDAAADDSPAIVTKEYVCSRFANRPLLSALPSTGDTIKYDGTSWVNAPLTLSRAMMYWTQNAVAENSGATIATGVPRKLAAVATIPLFVTTSFTHTSPNRLTWNGAATTLFDIDVCVASFAGDNDRSFEIYVSVNGIGTAVPQSRFTNNNKNATGANDSSSKSFLAELSTGDTVEVWIVNLAGATEFTARELSCVVKEVL